MLELLLKYNWEPEIEINFNNGQTILIVAYKTFIDFFYDNGDCSKFDNIKRALKEIKWNQIKTISDYDGVDFAVPIRKYAKIVDGKLWLL